MENRKGQQMTLTTIIAIVLGLVVLIFLIYGFSTGWGNLWQKITGLGGGDVNIDTLSTACTLACQQKLEYAFCTQPRDLVVAKNQKKIGTTCNAMASDTPISLTASGKAGTSTGTAKNIVDKCPEITCTS